MIKLVLVEVTLTPANSRFSRFSRFSPHDFRVIATTHPGHPTRDLHTDPYPDQSGLAGTEPYGLGLGRHLCFIPPLKPCLAKLFLNIFILHNKEYVFN